MNLERRTGRTVGILLLIQITGLIVPFVLLHPIAAGPPTHVATAAWLITRGFTESSED